MEPAQVRITRTGQAAQPVRNDAAGRISDMHDDDEPPALLTPAEVAKYFRVDPKTVTRWERAGKLRCIKTLGGHRRYLRHEVETLLKAK